MQGDDIEEVIKEAQHYRFHERPDKVLLNRISRLPESKKRLKRAIKERVRLLVGSYISLASFVPDEDVDAVIEGTDKERIKTIYRKVLVEMEKLTEEMADFDPFDGL